MASHLTKKTQLDAGVVRTWAQVEAGKLGTGQASELEGFSEAGCKSDLARRRQLQNGMNIKVRAKPSAYEWQPEVQKQRAPGEADTKLGSLRAKLAMMHRDATCGRKCWIL